MTFSLAGASAFVARIGSMPYGTSVMIPRLEWIDIVPGRGRKSEQVWKLSFLQKV